MVNVKSRLDRLERSRPRLRATGDTRALMIHEELGRDNPSRLAGVLQAAKRAGLLDNAPAPEDRSQFAEFLRVARDVGLVPTQDQTHVAVARGLGDAVPGSPEKSVQG